MPSFFTLPTSQRKRQRSDGPSTGPPFKKRTTAPSRSRDSNRGNDAPPGKRAPRDESISGSESESDDGPRPRNEDDLSSVSDSGSENEGETAADRRLRLAERYLENVREQVDEVGFDAEQIDRDLIAERLREDVAESKGRSYRSIARQFDLAHATQTQFRADTLATTSVAVCPPYAYTVSKDITLIKWKLCDTLSPTPVDIQSHTKRKPRPTSRRPEKLAFVRGNSHKSASSSAIGHTAPILSVAASADGKFVATAGADKQLIIWSAANLTPLKAFAQHRDSILSLAFRRGSNQLYSASKDRTIKLWSLDELAYVETLFGHQDEVVDIAALAQPRCVSVGARDRTARLWKVEEESQLVFRGGVGGGSGERRDKPNKHHEDSRPPAEGSIDRVCMLDEETFVTGSDNGALSLWNVHKKKPVFVLPLAHGRQPAPSPEEASAEARPVAQPGVKGLSRWITALVAEPYSDLVISGSWDGCVRIWRVVKGGRDGGGGRDRIEAVGVLGAEIARELPLEGGADEGGVVGEGQHPVCGVVNDLAVFERGERGKDGLCVVAGLGTESRLGRWLKVKGKNGAVVWELPRLAKDGKGVEEDEDERAEQ